MNISLAAQRYFLAFLSIGLTTTTDKIQTKKTKKSKELWKSDTMQSFKDWIYLSRCNGIFSHFFPLVWQQLRAICRQKLYGTLKLHYQWNFFKKNSKISQKVFLTEQFKGQENCLNLSGRPCNQLFSALRWKAWVKYFPHFFRFIYRLKIHVGFNRFWHIWGLLENFL